MKSRAIHLGAIVAVLVATGCGGELWDHHANLNIEPASAKVTYQRSDGKWYHGPKGPSSGECSYWDKGDGKTRHYELAPGQYCFWDEEPRDGKSHIKVEATGYETQELDVETGKTYDVKLKPVGGASTPADAKPLAWPPAGCRSNNPGGCFQKAQSEQDKGLAALMATYADSSAMQMKLYPLARKIGNVLSTMQNAATRKPVIEATLAEACKKDAAVCRAHAMWRFNVSAQAGSGTILASACDQGQADACGTLGWMHWGGYGVDKDQSKAMALTQRACDAGTLPSCSELGYYYAEGVGVAADLAKGIEIEKKACELDDQHYEPWACYRLGVYTKGSSPDTANKALERGCNGGVPAACKALGR